MITRRTLINWRIISLKAIEAHRKLVKQASPPVPVGDGLTVDVLEELNLHHKILKLIDALLVKELTN